MPPKTRTKFLKKHVQSDKNFLPLDQGQIGGNISSTSSPIQHKTVGGGSIKYKDSINKIPKSVYMPAGFKLDNSVIPGAGLGVFATKNYPFRYDLGPYKGKWLTPEEYNNSKKELLYVWEVNDYRGNKDRPKGQKYDSTKAIGYINGGPKKQGNFLRYLNHPRNESEENVVAQQKNGNIHYVIIKPVQAGQELMVNYGPSYGKELLGNGVVE